MVSEVCHDQYPQDPDRHQRVVPLATERNVGEIAPPRRTTSHGATLALLKVRLEVTGVHWAKVRSRR